MGIDISIAVNNSDQVYSDEYYLDENDYMTKHNLSRTFGDFISRQDAISHEPELEQIGRITNVDILPMYEMKNDLEDEQESNIDKVLFMINKLIEETSNIQNLPGLLIDTDFDSLPNDEYFANINTENEEFLTDNLKRDLKNFKSFLEYAKNKGTKTVWFEFE